MAIEIIFISDKSKLIYFFCYTMSFKTKSLVQLRKQTPPADNKEELQDNAMVSWLYNLLRLIARTDPPQQRLCSNKIKYLMPLFSA